jgi:hypothetical protein
MIHASGSLVLLENTPTAFANSIRVASTLGLTEKSDPTLKAFANAVWPTLSALNFFVSYVPGLSQAQPWAEICERLRRYFKLNHDPPVRWFC